MPKPSKTLLQITQRYESLGLDMEDSIQTMRRILEHYHAMTWLLEGDLEDLQGEGAAFGASGPQTGFYYLADFAPESQQGWFHHKVIDLYGKRESLRRLDWGLKHLQGLRPYGDTYYEILWRLYFAKEPESKNDVVCHDLALSRTTFYMRKREAIALLALVLHTRLDQCPSDRELAPT